MHMHISRNLLSCDALFFVTSSRARNVLVHNMGEVTKTDLGFGVQYDETFTVWPTAWAMQCIGEWLDLTLRTKGFFTPHIVVQVI